MSSKIKVSKQTSIEWFVNQLQSMGFDLSMIPCTIALAKILEYEDLKESYIAGCSEESDGYVNYYETKFERKKDSLFEPIIYKQVIENE